MSPPTDAAEAGDEASRDERDVVRSVVEWIAVVVGALVVALLVQSFLFQAFYIPSESMSPTLEKGDRVLVNKLSYDLHDVHRGDVVVFERPPNEPQSTTKDLIKRVIGLAGEVIEARSGSVYVDGDRLDEGYLPDGTTTVDLPRQRVPDGHVFVMGDNRGASFDSRRFGAIDEDLIVGRAFVLFWPLNHLGRL